MKNNIFRTAYWHPFLVCLLFTFVHPSLEQLSEDKEELLNWCLKSRNHKHKPGKEDSLHEQCRPWKDHACCSEGVTVDIHQLNMYNFTLDHCEDQMNRKMSTECRKYFNQDNCFYECEPHIGLWVVKTNRKIASERFYKVPLCASDCELWFDACKDDFTCAYNWPRDFKFSQGHNTCKDGSKCATFKETYGSAKDFCENVWDHSWEYTPNDLPCIHTWFNESGGNPNRKVAEFYIKKRFGGGAESSALVSLWLLLMGVALTLL